MIDHRYFSYSLRSTLLITLALVGLLANISDANEHTETKGWPRTIATPKGDVILTAPAQRIVSASVTLTGFLLSIDAPVIASGAAPPQVNIADEQGFFTQWGQIAQARQVQVLYHLVPNAEAIVATNPDLIIISTSGADSALRLYEQLSAITPTIAINYFGQSWEELTRQLSEITGREAQAEQLIENFSKRVLEVAKRITPPPQPSSGLLYLLNGQHVFIATRHSPQGQLLEKLGFTIAPIPVALMNSSPQIRLDGIELTGEKLAEGLTGRSILLFAADDQALDNFKQDKFLTHLTAIKEGHVYALGNDSFRLDYYSASNLLDRIELLFK